MRLKSFVEVSKSETKNEEKVYKVSRSEKRIERDSTRLFQQQNYRPSKLASILEECCNFIDILKFMGWLGPRNAVTVSSGLQELHSLALDRARTKLHIL